MQPASLCDSFLEEEISPATGSAASSSFSSMLLSSSSGVSSLHVLNDTVAVWFQFRIPPTFPDVIRHAASATKVATLIRDTGDAAVTQVVSVIRGGSRHRFIEYAQLPLIVCRLCREYVIQHSHFCVNTHGLPVEKERNSCWSGTRRR